MVDASEVAAILRPREAILAEGPPGRGPSGTYQFEQSEGPLAAYRRTVAIHPVGVSDQARVCQEVEFAVGVPYVSWLFILPLRARLGALDVGPAAPWWAPPARLSRRAAIGLARLCALTVLVGYLSDLLPDTMTYAAREFGVGRTGQGLALGVVQINAILALGLLARADRRGRRRVLITTAVAGAALTAAGAASPSLSALAASQVVAGALLTAVYVLVAILAVEEMPAGSRAWAVGVISMCFGLGSGAALAALPLADTTKGGWRWLFALGLLTVPGFIFAGRRLPESRRFVARTVPAGTGPAGTGPPGMGPAGTGPAEPNLTRRSPGASSKAGAPVRARRRLSGAPGRRALSDVERQRLVLLGAASLLLAVFATPAGQFQNEFLRSERHLSALRISLLEQVAGTIGGLGTLVGGRLADTHGRRPVAAAGVGLGAAVTLAVFFSRGVALWSWSIASSLLSYGVGPALSVYGAELFSTSARGRAGGILTVLAAAGGVVGLIAAGVLAGAIGTIGPALAILAAAPIAVVVLIARRYPETAGQELEVLNPGDPLPGVTA